jgi:predicted DCC family thiol-disulfide oxidoreductase YuxK
MQERGASLMSDAPVVLFDGTCNFCDQSLHFVMDHERAPSLRFAAIQSEPASALLERVTTAEQASLLRKGVNGDGDPDSVILIEDGHLFTHSSAALRIARYLKWPWSWLRVFVIVPRPLRDVVYRWFARHRYQWFGKVDACRVPTPELRARFLR